MAVIAQVTAGHYDGTYNASAVAYTQNGFEIEQHNHAELVNESDAYGQSIIDLIYQGGDVYIGFEARRYLGAGVISAFWPYGSLGAMLAAATPMGRRGTDVAAATVLTARASTPAATDGPATLTAPNSILAPGNLRFLFNSRSRNVPVRLLCLPDETAGTVTWFTTT